LIALSHQEKERGLNEAVSQPITLAAFAQLPWKLHGPALIGRPLIEVVCHCYVSTPLQIRGWQRYRLDGQSQEVMAEGIQVGALR
jgi:hypothetical protein